MDIGFSYYTSQGKRQNNEDAVSLLESNGSALAIIADGLGGMADGEVASQQALSTMNRTLQGKQPEENLLIDAIQQASRDIYIRQQPQRPMHTTVAALWLGEYGAYAAHVGDTRIYQFRDGAVLYQSVDHSMAQVAVLVGELRQEDLRKSAERNRLIRVLGNEEQPKVDCNFLTVQPGDRFLLCSDGFWETVTEEMMLQTMKITETARQWLDALRKIVLEENLPGQDNHTAVAIMVYEVG